MLPKGIDVRQRIEFISSIDNIEPKTVFVLRPLSSLEKTVFLSMTDRKESVLFYITNSIVEIKDSEFESKEDAINSIDDVTLGELLSKINEINGISKEEAKN